MSSARRTAAIDRFMTRHPRTVGIDQPLSTARRLMRDGGVEHLPVLEDGRLAGVVSARDLDLASSQDGVAAEAIPVRDLMKRALVATPHTRLGTAARRMAAQDHGCCVVVENDAVVGILSATDAVAALLGPTRQALS